MNYKQYSANAILKYKHRNTFYAHGSHINTTVCYFVFRYLGASQDCKCSSIFDPYCCDDKDFDNSCYAECNGFVDIDRDCTPGKCGSDCKCNLEYYPICCDDKNYYNQCNAECEGWDVLRDEQCQVGTCEQRDPDCQCTLEYEAICCNGEDYLNPCHAECNGIKSPAIEQEECTMGKCEDLCHCSHHFNPICCDGKDFSNECVAKCNDIFNPELCSTGTC